MDVIDRCMDVIDQWVDVIDEWMDMIDEWMALMDGRTDECDMVNETCKTSSPFISIVNSSFG